MAKEETGGDVTLIIEGRLSFADHVAEAEEGAPRAGGKHAGKVPYRWSNNVIIDGKDRKMIAAIEAAIEAVIKAKWPKDTPKIKADKRCLRDGDEESYAGYEGNWFVSASRTVYPAGGGKEPKRPFMIFGPRKTLQEDGTRKYVDDPSLLYAGCYVREKIRIWAQDDPEYGKRVNASIEAIQFLRDGEAFGGGQKTKVDDEFDEFGEDDDDLDDI